MAGKAIRRRYGLFVIAAFALLAVLAIAMFDRSHRATPRAVENILAGRESVTSIELATDQPLFALGRRLEAVSAPSSLPRGDLSAARISPSSPSHPQASLPGGGLPIEPVGTVVRHRTAKADGAALPPRDAPQLQEPARFAASDDARPITQLAPVARRVQESSVAEVAGGETASGVEPQTNTKAVPRYLLASANVPAAVEAPRDLFAIARELHDRGMAAGAQAKLAKLGLSPHLVAYAQAATDDDPRLRLKVVDAVPRLTGIDAPAWLLHFSHDAAAEVRQAALAIMATGGDSRFRERLEQMSAADSDDRVRHQARKAVEAPRNFP